MFVYHFFDLDVRVEIIFRKEEKAGSGDIYFEIGDIGTSADWYWRLKKISCRACVFFYSLFITSFKSPFDVYFYPFTVRLDYLDLRSYSSKIEEKIHITAVVLLCSEVLGKGFFCFPGREWEVVCWKLLSLVKLRFCIWSIDQKLNMALLIVAVCAVLF